MGRMIASVADTDMTAAWREVAAIAASHAMSLTTLLERRIAIIEAAMPILGLSSGAAQFQLARAGLLGSMELADHEALRCAMWRRGPMPQPSGVAQGMSVRLKRPYFERQGGYIRTAEDGNFQILTDRYQKYYAQRTDFVLTDTCDADFIPWRLSLASGYVRQADGSTIIFSHDEIPMWHIAGSGMVRQMEPSEPMPSRRRWVTPCDAVGRIWTTAEGRLWSLDLLAKYGIHELPLLVDIVPHLIGNGTPIFRAGEVMKADAATQAAPAILK